MLLLLSSVPFEHLPQKSVRVSMSGYGRVVKGWLQGSLSSGDFAC